MTETPALFKARVAVGYTLPTAVADLIDHCLAAGATHVRVSFTSADGRLDGVNVFDGDDDLAKVGDGGLTASLARVRGLADGPVEPTVSRVRDHLGVVFHRVIDAGVSIDIGVDDETRTVMATHPFGYPESGDSRYPKEVEVQIGTATATITAHIWPARSTSPAYRLLGHPGREFQGLFVYLDKRLVQMGGWNGLQHDRPEYGLGRMEIDLDDTLAEHIIVDPEKASVTLDSDLLRGLERVLDDGYMSHVETATWSARTPQDRPVSVVQPDSGLPEEVLDAFADEFTFEGGQYAVGMRWRELPADEFFEIDLTDRTLWINSRFRESVVGSHSQDASDASLAKSLLFLLVNEMFRGVRLTEPHKQKIRALQGVLIAAVTAH